MFVRQLGRDKDVIDSLPRVDQASLYLHSAEEEQILEEDIRWIG